MLTLRNRGSKMGHRALRTFSMRRELPPVCAGPVKIAGVLAWRLNFEKWM